MGNVFLAAKIPADYPARGTGMNASPLIEEPFFITEEIEAEMIQTGYVFEPPTHVCLRPRVGVPTAADDETPPATP